MRQPRNGEGLAAARRVLNQVALPCSPLLRVVHQEPHAFKLLIAGKDQEPIACLSAPVVFLFHFVDEPPQQVQHAVTCPRLLPEVSCGVAIPRWRNRGGSSPSVLPPIEGKESRILSSESGRYVDQLWVYGKVGQTAPIGEQGLPGVPVRLVLSDGVLDILSGQGVLELGREDGNAVEEEGEVEAALILFAVVQLPNYREQIALIKPTGLFIQPAVRAEVGELESTSTVPDSVAQHVERTPTSDLRRQPFQEPVLDLRTVMLGQPLPLPGLRSQHEVQDIARNEAQAAVIVLGLTLLVTAMRPVREVFPPLGDGGLAASEAIRTTAQQAGLNGVLKRPFGHTYSSHIASCNFRITG